LDAVGGKIHLEGHEDGRIQKTANSSSRSNEVVRLKVMPPTPSVMATVCESKRSVSMTALRNVQVPTGANAGN
jgi:hypothetical protein